MTSIKGSNILITGADGGLGLSIVKACIEFGAKKIYATGLNSDKLNLLSDTYDNVESYILDVTDLDQVTSLHNKTKDVNILINNAGIEKRTHFLEKNSIEAASLEMKVNYLGVLNICNTYSDSIKSLNNGAIINILSLGSLLIVPNLATYCASKVAAHYLTESIRHTLQKYNILVSAVYAGYIDTKMTEGMKVNKSCPDIVAQEIIKSINNGETHIYPDPMSKEYSKKICDSVLIVDLK